MQEEITTLLEKYNNFKDAQIRKIEQTDDAKIVTIVNQDDWGEDLETITLTFKGVTKHRILQNHVLPFLDMMRGVTIIEEKGLYGFALGNDTAMLHVHLAPLFIVAKELEISEISN